MQFSTIAIAFLASAVHALPQSGSPFFAVGNKYSGGGCTDSTLIFADPVFSPEGLCQPLNRSPGQNVVSYKRIDSITRCNETLFTTVDCTSTPFTAPIGGCVQANSPFLGVLVSCSSS